MDLREMMQVYQEDTNQVINQNCRFMLKDSEPRMVIYNRRTEAGEKSLPPFFVKNRETS